MEMLRLISMQMQTMFRKKGFQFTFIFMTVYALGVSVYYAYCQKNLDISSLYHPALLSGVNEICSYSWFFLRCYPFLVILPAGFSFLTDRNTRIQPVIIGRGGVREYYISKLIAGFIVTFLSITLPFLLELILNCIVFPQAGGRDMGNWPIYSNYAVGEGENYLFSSAYFKSPYLCLAGSLIMLGLFSGCAAVFIMGISTFRIKYKAILFLPVYLFMYFIPGISSLFIKDAQVRLDLYLVAYDGFPNKSLLYYVGVMFFMLLLGVGFTVFNEQKNL